MERARPLAAAHPSFLDDLNAPAVAALFAEAAAIVKADGENSLRYMQGD